MFHLSDITLVVLGSSYGRLTEMATDYVFERFAFDDVLMFPDIRSAADATRVAWKEVLPRLRTTHILSMHWDGYPVNADMWSDEFREYDFSGAVWPWFTELTVGNTGFSLQSRRFLAALAHVPMIQPEDITICRNYRPVLEQHGVRFAPEEVAMRFSREYWPPSARTFGFHGAWNMLEHLDDQQVIERFSLMTPEQWRGAHMVSASHRALWTGRRALFRWITGEIGRHGTA